MSKDSEESGSEAADNTEQLIEQYQKHTCLWDVYDSNYKNRYTRDKALREIAGSLGSTMETVRNKGVTFPHRYVQLKTSGCAFKLNSKFTLFCLMPRCKIWVPLHLWDGACLHFPPMHLSRPFSPLTIFRWPLQIRPYILIQDNSNLSKYLNQTQFHLRTIHPFWRKLRKSLTRTRFQLLTILLFIRISLCLAFCLQMQCKILIRIPSDIPPSLIDKLLRTLLE